MRQFGWVLCLMVSLAVGHISACACSHHAETKAVEIICPSHHQPKQRATSSAGVCDTGCVCFTEQQTPYIASKAPNTQFKTLQDATGIDARHAELKFVAVRFIPEPVPAARRPFHSAVFRSLMPSRAPPRL